MVFAAKLSFQKINALHHPRSLENVFRCQFWVSIMSSNVTWRKLREKSLQKYNMLYAVLKIASGRAFCAFFLLMKNFNFMYREKELLKGKIDESELWAYLAPLKNLLLDLISCNMNPLSLAFWRLSDIKFPPSPSLLISYLVFANGFIRK